MEEVLEQALRWRESGERVVLATLVAARGSAPRPLGSKLAISEHGRLAGSVSGGCVEADVAEQAREVLAGAPPRLISYGIADELAWGVGLPCGGEIDVFLEPLDGPLPETERGLRLTVLEGERPGSKWIEAGDGETGVLERGNEKLFAEALAPPLLLVVFGAVDVAEALCAIARTLGWRTLVSDPRSALATPERIPSADELHAGWPDEVLDRIDEHTAVVVLTHEERLDGPALAGALERGALYVGALGSRRVQAARRERLLAEGVDPSRISGPAGLDLGGRAPAEIALAVAAEILRRMKKGEEPESSPPENS